MAKLTPRYSRSEYERLIETIFPEERRYEFTSKNWGGEGFRHFLDPQIICLEHYWPRNRSVLPGAWVKSSRRKPAA